MNIQTRANASRPRQFTDDYTPLLRLIDLHHGNASQASHAIGMSGGAISKAMAAKKVTTTMALAAQGLVDRATRTGAQPQLKLLAIRGGASDLEYLHKLALKSDGRACLSEPGKSVIYVIPAKNGEIVKGVAEMFGIEAELIELVLP